MRKIIVTGGGTGGHLFPALAFANLMQLRNFEAHLITDLRCKRYLTGKEGVVCHIVDSKPIAGNIVSKIFAVSSVYFALIKSFLLFLKLRPCALVAFGGYPTLPPLLAAVILRVPIILHEENCLLGKINRIFTRVAKKISIVYPEITGLPPSALDKVVVTSNIVRREIKELNFTRDFSTKPFNILIFGGSQGAKIFSDIIPEAIRLVKHKKPNIKLKIVQQASKEVHSKITRLYEKLGVEFEVAEFFYDIATCYKNAHLVICRSGSSTVGEVINLKQPAIFIPYPHAAENHQYFNAMSLAKTGAAWCYEQSKITPIELAEQIIAIEKKRSILDEVSSRLSDRKTQGDELLADTVEKIIS